MVMVMVLHLCSAFSIWIYSNALYNTVRDFARLLYGPGHNLFNVTKRIHRCPQNRMNEVHFCDVTSESKGMFSKTKQNVKEVTL